MWWECPNCGAKVDFHEAILELFDEEDGEAYFDPEGGIYFHTIKCECGCSWTMGMSGIQR